MIKFDIKTGQVFIRNFDQAVIETAGGYIDYVGGASAGNIYGSGNPTGGSGDCRRNYYVDIPGLAPSRVPVVFNKPYARMEEKILPSILITRGNPSPDLNRWHSVGAIQYRVPSEDAIFESVTLDNGDVVSGWSEYEELVQAFPFNIPYTITVMSRYEHEAILMIKKILSVYKPYSRILLKDSLGALRTYTVFNESGFMDNSELADIVNRTKSYAVDIRIEGELDLSDPEINKTAFQFINNLDRV